MSIRIDPKAAQTEGVESPAPRAEGAAPAHAKPAASLPTMDRPPALPEPDAAFSHPARRHTAPHPPALAAEVERMIAALQRGTRKSRLEAARRALALAASYPLRRSRGARALALELCDAVAAVDGEREAAEKLKLLLEAEGELHDTAAASTLAACRHLIHYLEREPA
ncbi:MAG: hypothetical protein HY903_08645 [Deltaproteobacteria bacterium]|nr:hypothetical protein [Deltaproteobacteria bacterium]